MIEFCKIVLFHIHMYKHVNIYIDVNSTVTISENLCYRCQFMVLVMLLLLLLLFFVLHVSQTINS